MRLAVSIFGTYSIKKALNQIGQCFLISERGDKYAFKLNR